MVRSNIGISGWQVIGPVFAWVVGDELKDRIWVEAFQEFIWPSDHGGVVARLSLHQIPFSAPKLSLYSI